jgi:hypothetical protein
LRDACTRKKNGAITDTRVSLNNYRDRRRPQPAITPGQVRVVIQYLAESADMSAVAECDRAQCLN